MKLPLSALLALVAAAGLPACPAGSGAPSADAGGDGLADAPDDAPADGGDAGCPNDVPASCPPNPPSYSVDIAPILSRRCAPCHFPGGVEAQKHDFSTYPNVHAQAGAILGQIHACLMPPPDAGQPTADERAALLAWLVCGSPNN
jgi:hypothetical protein